MPKFNATAFYKSAAGTLVGSAMLFSAHIAFAAGSHGGGHGANIGQPGELANASRTVEIVMEDNYFEPENIEVSEGETVRFVILNKGEFVHEFNIGTAAMHASHQQEMMMMVEHGVLETDKINMQMMSMDMGNGMTMKHDDPNSVLLEPGKTAEIVWTFAKTMELEFACNVPGHYESGMMGNVTIQ